MFNGFWNILEWTLDPNTTKFNFKMSSTKLAAISFNLNCLIIMFENGCPNKTCFELRYLKSHIWLHFVNIWFVSIKYGYLTLDLGMKCKHAGKNDIFPHFLYIARAQVVWVLPNYFHMSLQKVLTSRLNNTLLCTNNQLMELLGAHYLKQDLKQKINRWLIRSLRKAVGLFNIKIQDYLYWNSH